MRIVFYWSTQGDYVIAKRLAEEARKTHGKTGMTRDANVFAGDVELCDRVVLLPSVRDAQADRIITAYRYAKVQIQRSDEGAAPVSVFDPTLTLEPRVRTPLPIREKLRRLTNRELRALAHDRGVDVEGIKDRASVMAALETAAQKES